MVYIPVKMSDSEKRKIFLQSGQHIDSYRDIKKVEKAMQRKQELVGGHPVYTSPQDYGMTSKEVNEKRMDERKR